MVNQQNCLFDQVWCDYLDQDQILGVGYAEFPNQVLQGGLSLLIASLKNI